MADGTSGIRIEKTLHMKDACVTNIDYTSLSKPILRESIATGGKDRMDNTSGEGKDLVRVSEDNGKTWTVIGEGNWEEQLEDRILRKHPPHYYLEPDNGMLVEFYVRDELGLEGDWTDFGPSQNATPRQTRTGRIFYRFSPDEGQTWGPEKQLIVNGPGYDAVHWADGLFYEKNSSHLMKPKRLRDGSIILPINFYILGEDGEMIIRPDRFGMLMHPTIAVASFRGRWREDNSDIDWEMSNHVTIPEYLSRGLDEPAVAELDDGKLMMVMRGNSSAWQAMTGVKFFAISQDQGRTWGPAVPLRYPDCGLVHSPGSYPNLFRSSRNGKVYLIANILPEPCYHCDPRYPLKIAEIDQTYFWVLPETETVIEDRQPRHSNRIRFSNWRRIEDRETGNPVIYMTEARADAIIPGTEGTFIYDSYRYEMILPD